MGLSYERWIGEMLEDCGHRAESIMWHVYGSWNGYLPQHNWDKFTLYDQNSSGHAACGNTHFAPNSTADYQWGNGDMRLHHKWWFNHFPRKAGVNADGKQNNWWKYLADFNGYADSR